jgi:hypothetical protein
VGAEFFSLGMIVMLHAAQLNPAARPAFAYLVFDLAHEENQ